MSAPVSTPKPNADSLGGQTLRLKSQTRVPEQKSPYTYNTAIVTSSLNAPGLWPFCLTAVFNY